MNRSFPPELQCSIQKSLQESAAQMGQPLSNVVAEQLYQDAKDLLAHLSHEHLTLARVAGILLVYRVQDTEPEELEWFKAQVQQGSSDEELEELIESMHRVDAL